MGQTWVKQYTPLQKRGDKNDLSACQNIAYKLNIPPYINHINGYKQVNLQIGEVLLNTSIYNVHIHILTVSQINAEI